MLQAERMASSLEPFRNYWKTSVVRAKSRLYRRGTRQEGRAQNPGALPTSVCVCGVPIRQDGGPLKGRKQGKGPASVFHSAGFEKPWTKHEGRETGQEAPMLVQMGAASTRVCDKQ